MAEAKKAILPFDMYVEQAEKAAKDLGVVVTLVEHPTAVTGSTFAGRFAGIRCKKSDSPRAQLSSGQWL